MMQNPTEKTAAALMHNKKLATLLLIAMAIVEGFSGLGIEIYAMRLASGYVGSSTSITGVIIAVMLIAIALGYWVGGKISNQCTAEEITLKASKYLGLSAIFQAIASTLQAGVIFLIFKSKMDVVLGASLLSLLFSVGTFFATASIPLMTQYLVNNSHDEKTAGKYTGIMVASTTFGSVLGSILTSTFLLPFLGLQATLTFFIALLAIASCVIGYFFRNKKVNNTRHYLFLLFVVSVVVVLEGFNLYQKFDKSFQTVTTGWYVFNGMTIAEGKKKPVIYMSDNPLRTISSCWEPEEQISCSYFYPRKFIDNIMHTKANTALMLGGAGFSVPSDHRLVDNNPNLKITIVDLDKDLPKIVQNQFLKKTIPSHISFVGQDARSYLLNYQGKKYDLVLLDVFKGKYIDGVIFTFENLKEVARVGDKAIANVIGVPKPDHVYTQTLASTWVAVFGDNAYWVFQHIENPTSQNMILCSYPCAGGEKIKTSKYFKATQEINTLDKITTDNILYQNL